MNCPKCNGERIEARKSGVSRLMRDATQYRMECLDCGETWAQKRGWRRVPGGEETPSEWANVTFVKREPVEVPPFTRFEFPIIKSGFQKTDLKDKEKP